MYRPEGNNVYGRWDQYEVAAAELARYIAQQNLSEKETGEAILAMIENTSATATATASPISRVFNYSRPVAGTVTGCVPDFDRTFIHDDWSDGESVVQAEQTTFEDGFNFRFHRIEDDLDALGAELASAYACIADLRAQVATALNELRTEINYIHQRLGESRPASSSAPTLDPAVLGRVQGTVQIDGRNFTLFDDDGRYTLIPIVDLPIPPNTLPPVTRGELKERLDRSGYLARFTKDKDPLRRWLKDRPEGFSVEELIEDFGDTLIGTGVTVEDAIVSVPSGTYFHDPEELIDMVTNYETAAVRGAQSIQEVLTTLGISDRNAVNSVEVGKLNAVRAEIAGVLIENGYTNVGELLRLSTEELGATLESAGLDVSAGDVAAIVADASAVQQLGSGVMEGGPFPGPR